jgi:ATPase subunit of ABC transporter with duplicated ATPase domains
VDHVMEIDHGAMHLYGGNYDYYLHKSAELKG